MPSNLRVLMKPNAYLKLGSVAMDFPFMADEPLF
jgi:hypothetical protein